MLFVSHDSAVAEFLASCERRRLHSDAGRHAPVAQLDRAAGFEPVGRGFKSLRARQFLRASLRSTLENDATIPANSPSGLHQRNIDLLSSRIPDSTPASAPNLKETHDANVDEN